jgi:hypothetical protein
LLSYIDKTFIEKQNIFYFETVSTLVNNQSFEKLIIHLESGHSIVFKNGINKRMKSKTNSSAYHRSYILRETFGKSIAFHENAF